MSINYLPFCPLLILRWTFQEHIENASTVLSQSVATIDRSVGQIIMIILNHSMYAICYLPWRVQIPQEVRGPGGHARQDGAPPGLRQLHRARDARRAGEDGVTMLYVTHNNRCMVQVYAECLLLKAMLTVCEDETLVSFVRAGLKVRQCYISFR